MVDNVDQNLAPRYPGAARRTGEHPRDLHLGQRRDEGRAGGHPQLFQPLRRRRRRVADRPGSRTSATSTVGGPRTMVHYPRGWGRCRTRPSDSTRGRRLPGRAVLVCAGVAGGAAERRRGHRPPPSVPVCYRYRPTVLELAGLPIRGSATPAYEGDRRLQLCSVLRANTASTHPEQYSELGEPGYYRDGWKLTNHTPGTRTMTPNGSSTVASDPNEVHNRAGRLRAGRTRKWRRPGAGGPGEHGVPVAGQAVSSIRRPAEAELERPVTLWPGRPSSSATARAS